MKLSNKFWSLLLFVTAVQMASLAFALTAEIPPPTTDAQAFDLFQSLWQFFVTKNYGAAVGPGLTLIVYLLKKYDLVIFNALKLPKVAITVDAFLDRPFVSFLLPTVIAGVAGGVTSLVTGHNFVDALNAVWQTSSTAIATYVGLRKIGEQKETGAEAAAAVDTKLKAVEELKKP